MSDLDANIALGRYDGPVGFERGIFGGFLIIFMAMLVLQNGVGLLVLYRKTLRRAMIAVISGTWRSRMQQYLRDHPVCPSIAYGLDLICVRELASSMNKENSMPRHDQERLLTATSFEDTGYPQCS